MSVKREYSTEYNDFKTAIIKSAMKNPEVERALAFVVDPDRLDSYLTEQGVVVIRKNLDSKPVSTSSIPFLSEYFVKQRLEWFDDAKEYATYIFAKTKVVHKDKTEEESEELTQLIHDLNYGSDDPNQDDVALLSKLVANYSCYFATTVSYISNDPQNLGRLSYSIICRANKVTIANENYKYNPGDMS